ncbi:hypothetical protein ACIBO2_10035 [Nonomuraea sp. NPDC050022]|uniref:hypothetical protein n=1 Tax=Nonomuraea sp. NPDC050022 TaxID=3364358 RepID=UPI00378926B5
MLLLFLSACGEKAEPETAPSATLAPSSAPAPSSALATPTTPAPESPKTKAPETAPPTARPSPSPSPSPSRKLAGPGTVCGELQPPGGGPMAAVAVSAGRADCRTALKVFRTYYQPDTPKQGSAGVATVGGWRCASNSAAQANMSGRLSSCQKAAARIVADVIP